MDGEREVLSKLALQYYDEHLNCAESVSQATADYVQKSINMIPLATPFGGGLGRTGNVCGAVTGALLGLGLVRGRHDAGDAEGYQRVAERASVFLTEFKDKFGSLSCGELTGYDLTEEAQHEAFRADPDRRERCRLLVAGAADLLQKILVSGE